MHAWCIGAPPWYQIFIFFDFMVIVSIRSLLDLGFVRPRLDLFSVMRLKCFTNPIFREYVWSMLSRQILRVVGFKRNLFSKQWEKKYTNKKMCSLCGVQWQELHIIVSSMSMGIIYWEQPNEENLMKEIILEKRNKFCHFDLAIHCVYLCSPIKQKKS